MTIISKTDKGQIIVTIIILVITFLSNFAIAQNKPAPQPEPKVQPIAGLSEIYCRFNLGWRRRSLGWY
ncbi:MAG: hypothetical protein LBC74_04755 [Planctomycetaceae bacterium]|nr:hypothetical protein [Planctomycetaceae bacterium]